jgi:hypothetical protein
VYDRVSNRIYASVPGNPGSITTINPETGAIGLSIEVGNQPNKLALSDDGQFLYVGLDGESAVRRVHIPSFMAGLLIPVSLSPNNLFPICGTVRIGDIEVLPGVSNAVAISKYHSGCSPRFAEVAVYDDEVQRPNFVQRVNLGPVIANVLGDFIEFPSSSSTLYGCYDKLYTFAVDSSGLSILNAPELPEPFLDGGGEIDNGLLYTVSGHIINPVTRTVVGQFQGTPSGGRAIVKPDSTVGRIFFLPFDVPNCQPVNLLAFDQTTLQFVGSNQVQGLNCSSGLTTMSSLVRWGTNGLAFRTFGGEVVLLKTSLIP